MSQLLIAYYFLSITYRQGADDKKVLQLKQRVVYLFAIKLNCDNVFVMKSPFLHYRGVTLDWLPMLDFQPIKTVCV